MQRQAPEGGASPAAAGKGGSRKAGEGGRLFNQPCACECLRQRVAIRSGVGRFGWEGRLWPGRAATRRRDGLCRMDGMALALHRLSSPPAPVPLLRTAPTGPLPPPPPRPIPPLAATGPARLPHADTPYGRVSGAICFDMDHPSYVREAGLQRVDLMLQPSWTWGSIGQRHFATDALRAVENGFSLLRWGRG